MEQLIVIADKQKAQKQNIQNIIFDADFELDFYQRIGCKTSKALLEIAKQMNCELFEGDK